MCVKSQSANIKKKQREYVSVIVCNYIIPYYLKFPSDFISYTIHCIMHMPENNKKVTK